MNGRKGKLEIRKMGKKKNGLIEFYRFLFALLIMLSHGDQFFAASRFAPLFNRASLGVEFFFFVSGYLMASHAYKMQQEREKTGTLALTGKFIAHKYFGLMPEYAVAVCISFFIFCCYSKLTLPIEILKKAWIFLWELIPLSMLGVTGGQFHMGAWYVSAMLLGMLVLYPICLKWFDQYTRIMAPLIAIVLLGMLQIKYSTPLGPSIRVGIFYKGMIRAIAELSAGAALFPLVQNMQGRTFSKQSKTIIDVILIILTVSIFTFTFFAKRPYRKYDIVCAAAILVLVALAFSHQGSLAERFDNRVCSWLGSISMLIYFSHVEYAKYLKRFMKHAFVGLPERRKYLLVIMLYFVGTALIMTLVKLISDGIRRRQKRVQKP